MSEVDSINPNTPVTSNATSDGKIEMDATGGPLSFDELEELTISSKNSKAKGEKKEPKEEKKAEKSKDLTSDENKGKKPEATEKKSESNKKEAKGTEEVEKPPRKTIKAKYNEAELELDEEAIVPVKINGKEEMVPVKELLGNYSGKVAWDKKFSELDQTRKTVSTKEMKVKEIEDLIKSAYEEQDFDMKLDKLSKLAGVDTVQFRANWLKDNISFLEKYYAMSDDERKAADLAYEAKVQKHRADTLEKGIKEKQAFEALQSKVNSLRERHQISEEEFVSKYDYLENLVKANKLEPESMNPEYIVQTIKIDRLWNAAKESLDKLDLGWTDAQKVQNLQKFVTNAHQIGLKPEDMSETVDEIWGVKKAQKKIEEKKKENQEFLSGKKDVPQYRQKSDSPSFFDEI